ncbi:MAG: N-acetylmuramoyl-L-alanine amidase [Sphingomonadales bacterium]|nr:N-acetylmuramoyl-L-alanine amidase [Sphingomonadales bacterium]
MPAAIIMSALLGLSSPAMAGAVAGIDIGDDTITVRFDEPVTQASSFVLAGPNRIALDIAGTAPGAPVDPSGPVANIRQGRFAADTVRVVFDLNAPTLITNGRFSRDGRELKLAIVPVGDDAIADASHAPRQIYRSPIAQSSRPPRSRYSLNIPLDPPEPGLPRPVVSGRADRPLVVIDAGHGGHDPGAISQTDSAREKDITLAVARAIRDELVRGGRVRVALTREDDRFLVLQERAQIARGLKADLFISIHADSAPNTGATGATIYTLSEVASDATAARLANRENKADIINGVNLSGQGSDVSSILIDLAQRETMNASSRFADILRREATGEVPFRGEFHRMAGFAVLKAPDTPAVLLEVGYITNPLDVARLVSPEGRAAIAGAVRRAVDIQFARKMASR